MIIRIASKHTHTLPYLYRLNHLYTDFEGTPRCGDYWLQPQWKGGSSSHAFCSPSVHFLPTPPPPKSQLLQFQDVECCRDTGGKRKRNCAYFWWDTQKVLWWPICKAVVFQAGRWQEGLDPYPVHHPLDCSMCFADSPQWLHLSHMWTAGLTHPPHSQQNSLLNEGPHFAAILCLQSSREWKAFNKRLWQLTGQSGYACS